MHKNLLFGHYSVKYVQHIKNCYTGNIHLILRQTCDIKYIFYYFSPSKMGHGAWRLICDPEKLSLTRLSHHRFSQTDHPVEEGNRYDRTE